MKITWINKWVSVLLAFLAGMHFGQWLTLSNESEYGGTMLPLAIALCLFSCAVINQMSLLAHFRVRDYYDRRTEK